LITVKYKVFKILCKDNPVCYRTEVASIAEATKFVCFLSCIILSTSVDLVIANCAGYPVLRNKVDFRRTDKAANKEDLNKIVTATKVTDGCRCA